MVFELAEEPDTGLGLDTGLELVGKFELLLELVLGMELFDYNFLLMFSI